MLEYVIAFAALLVVSAIVFWLARVSAGHAVRTENLVSSNYP